MGAGMFAAIKKGYTGSAAVITEPTGLDIVTVQAGAISFRLIVPGRAAHAAMRRTGVSALEKLDVLREALKRNEDERNRTERRPELSALDLPYPTSIGTVNCGNWSSTVPDQAIAEGRYGVRLGQTTEEAADELRSVITDACEKDPWLADNPASITIYGGRFGPAELAPWPSAAGRPGRGREARTGRKARFAGALRRFGYAPAT